MEIIIWITIIGGTAFMVWYGFNLLVKKPGVASTEEGGGPAAQCHLCRRPFPVSQMVSRDKIAGFINYFCGDCIESLYDEYVNGFRDGKAPDKRMQDAVSRN